MIALLISISCILIIFFIVMIVILNCHSHNYIENATNIALTKQTPLSNTDSIPKNIHMTWINKESVPDFVWTKLKNVIDNTYKIYFYDDDACIDYLKKYYGLNILRYYRSQKKGAHRADIFRYAVLYNEGGIYLDIKTDIKQYVPDIFPDNIDLITVHTPETLSIYNGVLACKPRLPIILKALIHACTIGNKKDHYMVNTEYLFSEIRKEMGKTLTTGLNIGANLTCLLYEEMTPTGKFEDYTIFDDKSNIVAKTRYPKYYEWQKKQKQNKNTDVIEII